MKPLLGLTIVTLLSVVSVAAQTGVPPESVKLDPEVQRQIDLQVATPRLDSSLVIPSLDLRPTTLRETMAAITQTTGLRVRYHSAVASLDTVFPAVKLVNAKVEEALRVVVDSRTLAFQATGARSVFIYPNTPENRQKYTESVRAFPMARASATVVNSAVTTSLALRDLGDDLAPVITGVQTPAVIFVRATPEMMARIAKVIADNDK